MKRFHLLIIVSCLLFFTVVTVHNGFALEHKLAGQNLVENDLFASSVAIDGDYAVVGTPGDNNGRGSASIFARNQGGSNNWGLIVELVAADGETGDNFGRSVDIANDYVIIGAPGDDDRGNGAGAAYLFNRNQGGKEHWGLVKKITPETAVDAKHFGASAAIGSNYAIIGAPEDDDSGIDAGAAYIYARNLGGDNNWGLVKKLHAEGTVFISGNPDNFGASTAIDGDYAVIGAPGTDYNGIDAGVAYVFYRHQDGNDSWGQQVKLAASDGSAYDHFAEAVSISGPIALIGSAFNTNANGPSQTGAAYFFYQNLGGSNNWGERKKVIAGDGSKNDHFGGAVDISNNYAIVGSARDDDKGFQSGAAYILERNQGGNDQWGTVQKLIASDGKSLDFAGQSVAIDSGFTAVVGAPQSANRTGAAYIFDHENGSSPRIVGNSAGLVNITASASELLTLQVNTTNNHQDIPAQTWLVFLLIKGGQTSSLYLLTNTGVEEVTAATNFGNSQFTFTGTPVQTLLSLRMADLELQSGDSFYYAYAYSTTDISQVVVENIVAITVQ